MFICSPGRYARVGVVVCGLRLVAELLHLARKARHPAALLIRSVGQHQQLTCKRGVVVQLARRNSVLAAPVQVLGVHLYVASCNNIHLLMLNYPASPGSHFHHNVFGASSCLHKIDTVKPFFYIIQRSDKKKL